MECSWMMGELLGPKLITHYSAIKEWNSLWRRQQLHFSSFNKFHSTKQRKVNFSFFLLNFICLHEDKWNEMKRKYYNSNLYEADSYLVIIIECFCEEWTNTWNWLRRELVAELNEFSSFSLPSIMNEMNDWLRREIKRCDWRERK